MSDFEQRAKANRARWTQEYDPAKPGYNGNTNVDEENLLYTAVFKSMQKGRTGNLTPVEYKAFTQKLHACLDIIREGPEAFVLIKKDDFYPLLVG